MQPTNKPHFARIVSVVVFINLLGLSSFSVHGVEVLPDDVSVHGEDPLSDENTVPFIRGDSNNDGLVDFSDAIYQLESILLGSHELTCLDAGDMNLDNRNDFTDPILLLQWVLLGADPPPYPGPFACDVDRFDSELGCVFYPPCDFELPLNITVDPNLDIDHGIDVQALRDEAGGTGELVLADGGILEGRIVRERLHIPDNAEVYVMAGAEIIVTEESYIGGTLIPIDDPDHVEPGVEEDEGDDDDGGENEDESPLVGDDEKKSDSDKSKIPDVRACPEDGKVTRKTNRGGRSFRSQAFTLLGRNVIKGKAFGACPGDPLEDKLKKKKDSPPVDMTGDRSVHLTGGSGGDGRTIEIRCVGLGASLIIKTKICNPTGGDGGAATGTGADGPPCDCGGDAWVMAGNGGNSGNLLIFAAKIIWDVPVGPWVEVSAGGKGGDAIAIGGRGGDCTGCKKGGRGGNAVAVGGQSGRAGRVRIVANQMEDKSGVPITPADVLGNAILNPGASGGRAIATAGNGGHGGNCVDCPDDGPVGGEGGEAYTRGGEGGKGIYAHSFVVSEWTATRSSNGGNGGWASSHAGVGGEGGAVADCKCSDKITAGRGGDGGKGGNARSFGGQGGGATWGPTALRMDPQPKTGDGGNAFSKCGDGGKGANGGNCIEKGRPILCEPGAGGLGGKPGTHEETGGFAGNVEKEALSGINGSESFEDCAIGKVGTPGVKDCEKPPVNPPVPCIPKLRDAMVEVVPEPWLQEFERLLKQVEELLEEGEVEQAVGRLDFLIQEIFRLVEARQISPDQADGLLEQVQGCLQELEDLRSPVSVDIQDLRETMLRVVPRPLILEFNEILDQVDDLLERRQVDSAVDQVGFFRDEIFLLIESEQFSIEEADLLIEQTEAYLQKLVQMVLENEIPAEIDSPPFSPMPNPPVVPPVVGDGKGLIEGEVPRLIPPVIAPGARRN